MKNNNISGGIVIDKRENISSRKEIASIGKILDTKVGHIGTLDPFASGMMLCLLGKATKLSKYMISHDKKYDVTFELGYETDTLDITGNVYNYNNDDNNRNRINNNGKKNNIIYLSDDEIIKAIQKEVGGKMQVPPVFSAKKIDGKKLYEIARKDYDLAKNLAKKKVSNIVVYDIYDIVIERKAGSNILVSCSMHVSSGTYIRSVVRDIGYNLGTYATVTKLRRTSISGLEGYNMLNLDDILAAGKEKATKILKKNIITEEELLKIITNNSIRLTDDRKKAFLNGLTTDMEMRYNKKMKDGLYLVYLGNDIIGLGSILDNNLKREYII